MRGGRRDMRPAVIVTAIFLGAFALTALYAVPITHFLVMPDELVYAKAAGEIWHSPLLVGHGSDWFVSWSQLLPLLDAVPLGATSDMTGGIHIAHLLGAASMALTAVPSYLLAREVTGDRTAGYLVAALAVSVPWMAMSAALMTEVVAYPAFVWAAYAATRACTQPSTRNDALALLAAAVAVFARAQLVFVPVILLVTVAACVLRQRRPIREHRVLVVVAGAAVIAFVAVAATRGSSEVLGAYSALTSSRGTSADIAGRLVAYVALAVAAAPVILGVPWMVTRLVRPERRGEFPFAVFACASIPILIVQSSLELSQPGRVQDRYLLYALPLLFTAMAAALLSRRRLVLGVAVTGVLLAALVSRFDFVETGAELTSPSFTLHRPINQVAFSAGDIVGVTDLSPGWFLAALLIPITGLLAVTMRDGHDGRRRLWAVGLAVLAFCLFETGDAFRQVHHSGYGFGYREPKPRNWIDQTVPPGARVALIVDRAGDPLTTPLQWWDAAFWNRKVDRFYVPAKPGLPRWGQPSVHSLAVDRAGHPRDSREWWLVSSDNPEVPVRGGEVIAQAGPLQLRRSTPAAPLRVRQG